MQEWIKISILLCTFGLVKEIRPSESYVTEFLTGQWRNLTNEDVYSKVYPVGTYCNLILLVVVFLVTDYLRYKPLIVLSGLSGTAVYVILLWTESLEWLQASQFFYGLFMSTEVAYYTYMYTKVEEDKYEKVSSWTRAALLLGKFLSGVLTQIIISFHLMDLRELNYITLTAQVLSIIFSLLLPSVSRSVYFHREATALLSSDSPADVPQIQKAQQLKGISLLWEHARSAYSRPEVLGWSLWYACSMCGYVQVQCYIQFMWKEIEGIQRSEAVTPYNGLIKAIVTILGVLAALFAGKNKINMDSSSVYMVPAVTAFVQAGATLLSALAQELWISYLGSIILGITYQYIITFTSAIIAKKLVYSNCFGLIFGINALVSVGLQSLLTVIVITAMKLPTKLQFVAYAVYYMGLGVVILLVWIWTVFTKRRKVVT